MIENDFPEVDPKFFYNQKEKSEKQPRLPNETIKYYGRHDTGNKCKIGENGTDHFTFNAIQELDWDNNAELDFSYTWNKYGYRGPDDLTDVGIVFAGGSLLLGTGIPYEMSIPYLLSKKLALNHFNISDFDTLTDMADNLFDFKLDPKYVILTDFWGVNDTNWLMRFWLRKEKDEKVRKLVRETFKQSNGKIFKMFELALLQAFPNAQYYILEPNERRKHWFYDYQPTHIKSIQYSKEEMIDLGRDQTHPGPKTHEYLTNKVLEEINKGN